jgi:hypothetical protein
MTSIFISYSSKDVKIAERIHNLLDNDFEVWRDESEIRRDWSKEIADALSQQDIVLLIWTKNASESQYVKNEWMTARALGKLIKPILFSKDVSSVELPKPLKTIVICKIPFEALEASEVPLSHSKQSDFANATTSATESDHEIAFDKTPENHAQNQDPNATITTNAIMQTSLDEEPDPSLASATEYLKNLREAEQARIQKSKNKSKLAEMTETSLSGNGFMPGNRESEK